MRIDFLARQPYFVDHLLPIYLALPSHLQGDFYAMGATVRNRLVGKVPAQNIRDYVDDGECGHMPIVTAAYGDAVRASTADPIRRVILIEHGVGLTFGKAAYADGAGQRNRFALIPVQNQFVFNKVHPEVKHIPHPIVGVPKLDKWKGYKKVAPKDKPLIVFAFHHGDKHSRPAEVGSAWEHYYEHLPILAKSHNIAVHHHPSSGGTRQVFTDLIRQHGIREILEFDEVMSSADVLINDCGSASYEFTVTGKPVILLNAPWFDPKREWGIRFWSYADTGIQVNNPGELHGAILDTLALDPRRLQRERAVRDLFPHFGNSVNKIVQEITDFLEKPQPKASKAQAPSKNDPKPTTAPDPFRKPTIKAVEVREDRTQGVLYMAFGKKALNEFHFSLASLRATTSTLPVSVVTNTPEEVGDDLRPHVDKVIPWQGQNPFDTEKQKNFQFRAGRVKPFFYKITPYEQTLYVDCDVEFIACPDDSFGFLKNWDFVIAQERLALSQLYNARGGRWYHDIHERDYTVEQFGAKNGDFPFWNSGVFWWKKCKNAKELFELWYEEWMVFEGWDEQKALMRAGNRSNARIFVLSEIWNYPHREDRREKYFEAARLILHEYGTGTARSDVDEVKE
ncbi:MAG TPA: hypothetical protein PLL95_05035 [Anaerolineales bacterium]|nr:hypothetical protein [Anaerolineales bacterium]